MGMDIYSEHGVVFEVSDLALRLFGNFKKTLVAEIKEKLKTFLTEINKDNVFDGPIAVLARVKTGQNLGEWFANFCEDQLVGEDVNDRYFRTYEHMLCVWDEICGAAGLNMPTASFRYWNRGRLNGWDVPIDVPCIVFDDESLFETKMTAAGKRLAKLLKLKELTSVTWTELSV
jgi:hypothetical protein